MEMVFLQYYFFDTACSEELREFLSLIPAIDVKYYIVGNLSDSILILDSDLNVHFIESPSEADLKKLEEVIERNEENVLLIMSSIVEKTKGGDVDEDEKGGISVKRR